MPRVRTATKEQSILESAARIFAVRPYHEVLIDHIAADAGIGKGTIYRYFETKDDLYFATLLYVMESLAAALQSALPQEASPSRRLERIASEILTFFWDRRFLIPLLQRDERPDREGAILKRREPILRFVQESILAGIERREFRGVDARIGAELFLGMTRSANLFRRPEDTREELVAHVMSVFLQGISRKDA
jgi:AcrR family transcriptional regulator